MNRPGDGGSSASVWDRLAETYDAQRAHDPVYRSCVRRVARSVRAGTRLALDAGCGTGWATAELKKRCETVVALDYSMQSLRTLVSKSIPGVLAVQADVRQLPFRDSVFDASVCANTLQHLEPSHAQPCAVEELRRVTRDDGVVALSVHHYSTDKRRNGWVKEGKPGQPGIDYIFRFTRDELAALAPGARVRGIGFYGLSRWPGFGTRAQDAAARVLGGLAARRGYGHMLLGVFRNQERRRALVPRAR